MKDKLSDISRRMTGTILLLPLMVLFFSGEPYSKITVLICAAFMVLEYSFLATKNINLRIILIGIIGCFGSTSLFLLGPIYHLVFLLLLLVLLLKFFPYGTIIMGIFLAMLLYSIGNLSHNESFQEIMTFIVFTVISVDIGAYIIGRCVGGPKLIPLISPAKTISGAIGGLVGGTSAGIGIFFVLNFQITFWLFLITLFVAVLAQLGDITASFFKRSIDTKDSAKTIPGHGGFLDRFDGYIYVIPIFALLPINGLFV